MREIVRRYEWRTRNTPYVFPLLTAEEPGRAYSQYQIALNYYNRQLKRLSQLLGLEEGLSSYASRHSWATAARNHRCPSRSSARAWDTPPSARPGSISSLESSAIDCANRKILSALTRIVTQRAGPFRSPARRLSFHLPVVGAERGGGDARTVEQRSFGVVAEGVAHGHGLRNGVARRSGGPCPFRSGPWRGGTPGRRRRPRKPVSVSPSGRGPAARAEGQIGFAVGNLHLFHKPACRRRCPFMP